MVEVRRETPSTVTLVLADAGPTLRSFDFRPGQFFADRAESGRIDLLCSSRSAEDIIFADDLSRLERENPGRLSVTHVLTGRYGRLGPEGVRRWLDRLAPADGTHYYLCGPEPLMDVVHGDCMVRLRDGEVAQNEPNCLTPQQRAAGYVLACVGCPLSKVTLDVAEPGTESTASLDLARKRT